MSNSIVQHSAGQNVPAIQIMSTELQAFLQAMGLPNENVLVSIDQRQRVLNNLPGVLEELSFQQRGNAMYVSKFIGACVVGLFDAALNYLWNETVTNLRQKITNFDLSYFYDSTITDPIRRSKFQGEADLVKVEDWELVKGCLTTGLLTEVGYRHLDYIRDMRNHASAAHPNQNDLTGLQLVSWLETCIREVLSKDPSGPAVEIRKLLTSIRNEIFTAQTIPPIANALPLLPPDLSRSLLRTVFGMFTDTRVATDVRNNIALIAKHIWSVCDNTDRYECGMRFASLEANGEIQKAALAKQFLQLVDGLMFLPKDRLALEISSTLDSLMLAHNGFNNFHNEPLPAKLLASLIPENGDIPASVESKYVKTIVMCRIGNGYGISNAAVHYYDILIARFLERHILMFVALTWDTEVASRLQLPICAHYYQTLARQFSSRAANQQLRASLEFIATRSDPEMRNLRAIADFKRITAGLMRGT